MDAERNLLFGMLALQNGFVAPQALLVALDRWASDKTRPLDELLSTSGCLDGEQRQLLYALVEQHLKAGGRNEHGNGSRPAPPADVEYAAPHGANNVSEGSLGHALATDERSGVEPASHRDPRRAFGATLKGPQSAADEFKTKPAAAGTATSSGRRFDLLRPLAKGGIGQVWVAQDMELHREVAFKELQERFADNGAFRDDFLLEAEITGGLEHPSIVPIYGLGQHPDGRPFYAMRFVRGESLHEALERLHAERPTHPDPGKRVLKLHKVLARFVDACNAVEYAHSRGVIHRDLKPLNIMLGKFGETFVVDWGEAKTIEHPGSSSEEPPLQTRRSRDTDRLGKPVGTPAYMSPEQAAGRHDLLGPASDVYCLGATLYHVLTGRAPIAGSDSGDVLRKAMKHDVRPPREVNKAIPPALAAICQKAMAANPAERYRSARALANDIEHWMADERVTAHTESWPGRAFRVMRHHKSTTAALAAALAVLIFGGGFAVEMARRENERTRANDLAEALLTADPSAVPHLLDALHPYGATAMRCVREYQKSDVTKDVNDGHQSASETEQPADETRRLRVAYALADLGDGLSQVDFLLARLTWVPAEECRSLVAALAKEKQAALQRLQTLFLETSDAASRARMAIVALHLGDLGPARDCLRVGGDPTFRTAFIHAFAGWHGGLSTLPSSIAAEQDGDLLSGLSAAIGRIASDSLPSDERQAAISMLQRLSEQAVDGATHSASRWALKRWKQTSRPLSHGDTAALAGKRWYVNRQQMAMIEISPSGPPSGETGGHWRPFYLSSCEVTIAQFLHFLEHDRSFASSSTANSSAFANSRESPACPVNEVSWPDALLFCNWLSEQEGLSPAYTNRRIGEPEESATGPDLDPWQCDLSADGYRLPTQAEWQWACRGGAAEQFDFHFGNDAALLPEYGWYLNDAEYCVRPVGMKLPNAFGLFDMHGNVEEWCWDVYAPDTASESVRRGEPKRMQVFKPAPGVGGRAVCGGNCSSAATDCAWNQVRGVLPAVKELDRPAIGFRVARTKVGK